MAKHVFDGKVEATLTADSLLATKPHNKDILWVGNSGKHVPEKRFAFSY